MRGRSVRIALEYDRDAALVQQKGASLPCWKYGCNSRMPLHGRRSGDHGVLQSLPAGIDTSAACQTLSARRTSDSSEAEADEATPCRGVVSGCKSRRSCQTVSYWGVVEPATRLTLNQEIPGANPGALATWRSGVDSLHGCLKSSRFRCNSARPPPFMGPSYSGSTRLSQCRSPGSIPGGSTIYPFSLFSFGTGRASGWDRTLAVTQVPSL